MRVCVCVIALLCVLYSKHMDRTFNLECFWCVYVCFSFNALHSLTRARSSLHWWLFTLYALVHVHTCVMCACCACAWVCLACTHVPTCWCRCRACVCVCASLHLVSERKLSCFIVSFWTIKVVSVVWRQTRFWTCWQQCWHQCQGKSYWHRWSCILWHCRTRGSTVHCFAFDISFFYVCLFI